MQPSLKTSLSGRLRNTPLPKKNGLMPLFEAIINSIHSISERWSILSSGEIFIEIIRDHQEIICFSEDGSKRGTSALGNIIGFKVTDNGSGFHDKNMQSFQMLDSEYKANQGCRGIGRLLWLKAFDFVKIESVFSAKNNLTEKCNFDFSINQGVFNIIEDSVQESAEIKTCVYLSGFKKIYQESSPKSTQKIASSIFEHCLWYFVKGGDFPKIVVFDESDRIDLEDLCKDYLLHSSAKESTTVNDYVFEIQHVKLKSSVGKSPFIAWCAASRVVVEENLVGKISGLYGKIKDKEGDFIYACYVTSNFLDNNVRPERIGFDINNGADEENLFGDLSMNDIRREVTRKSSVYLEKYIEETKKSSRDRIEKFVSKTAPRYRPILKRIDPNKLIVDPEISDKNLDLYLHKLLSEIEFDILSEGHSLMNFGKTETIEQYRTRVSSYLDRVSDIKKSDLASYVFHRKVVLDILEKTIQKTPDGKYAREDLIHELIIPMKKTSNDVFSDNYNLWLIDERLAFHDFLASDKTLLSMPITGDNSTKEPDIFALNIFDEPILVSDKKELPLASIVIIEIKRPMRNDARSGEDKDPVEQSLGYLERIRQGDVQTASGRAIPRSEDIPGFCYIICDITKSIEKRCKLLGLSATNDYMGYFGYNPNYKTYIEVISFDRLINSAKQRNRSFFEKLGIS